jgi:hypothetical protein
MIAIETKFLPTTNCKGSRIKAFTCNGHSVTIPYPHEFTGHVCHFEAVKALAKKCKTHWELDKMRYGGTKQWAMFSVLPIPLLNNKGLDHDNYRDFNRKNPRLGYTVY